MPTYVVKLPRGITKECKICNTVIRTTGEETVIPTGRGGGRFFWVMRCPNCGYKVAMSCSDGTSSNTGEGIHCFVATCCFGDMDAPEVVRLRRWRDEKLINYAMGRRFVAWYYSGFGNHAATFIGNKPVLRHIGRAALGLLIRFAVK